MKNLVLAYLDPGTGSFILQMLIAFAVGASFFIKMYWRKVKNFFSRFFQKN